MTSPATACARRASALAAAVIALVAGLAAAALAPGCDRTVNLTPFYDAPPALDGGLVDGGFDLDAIPDDGPFADDGRPFPDDGPFSDDGPSAGDGQFPDDGPLSDDGPLPRGGSSPSTEATRF